MRKTIWNLSVDCVVFGFHDNTLNVLLTLRELKDKNTGATVFKDYTLQGHHVFEGEQLDEAAARVLKEKTGLQNIFLKQFHTFGDPGRVLKERDQLWIEQNYPQTAKQVFTVAYCSLVDSSRVVPDKDHEYSQWFPVNSLPDVGFDHMKIIRRGLEYLRQKIRKEPVGFELLPEKFTLPQLQKLYEVILGITIDKRNFRRKVAQMKYVIPLSEKTHVVSNKHAQLYIFSKEVYSRTRKERARIVY